ncbi:hypothetical protein MJO28_007219, partial [Puccinia striiformis f. sp. tritici]
QLQAAYWLLGGNCWPLLAKQGHYTVPSISSAPLTVSFRYSTKQATLLNHNSLIDIGNDLEIATGFGPSPMAYTSPPRQQTFGLTVKPPQHQQSWSLTNSFVNSLAYLTVVWDQWFTNFISLSDQTRPTCSPLPPLVPTCISSTSELLP